MKRVFIVLALVAALTTFVPPNPAVADSCETASASTYQLGVDVTFGAGCPPTPSSGSTTGIDAIALQANSAIDLTACIAMTVYLGASEDRCFGTDDPVLTSGMVRNAFARLPFPSSTLEIQPPNGRTLVNFDTNFFTEREPFTRAVTLLGQRVELRIFPTAFTWRFDDGDSLTTTSPGSPYPDLDVTHAYLRKGDYAPSVDTTYGADWRVGNGGWQRVPGTVTIAGQSVDLRAVEVRPTLVSSR